ncbi:bifunctional metallophosphatase/5-nucleotidase [Sesbania bispinosa]|nr:bifunctional metallophosphatase/5-nucleotidase [Sesbania bispinosa]
MARNIRLNMRVSICCASPVVNTVIGKRSVQPWKRNQALEMTFPWRRVIGLRTKLAMLQVRKRYGGDRFRHPMIMGHGWNDGGSHFNALLCAQEEEKDYGAEVQTEVQVNPKNENEVQLGWVASSDKPSGEGPKSVTKLRALACQSIRPKPIATKEAHSPVQQKDKMVQDESNQDMAPSRHLRLPVVHHRTPGIQPKPTTLANLVVDLEICNYRAPDGTSSKNQGPLCIPNTLNPPIKGKEEVNSITHAGIVRVIPT